MSDPRPDGAIVATGADTMRDVLAEAAAEGWDTQFTASEQGDVRCGSCQKMINTTALDARRVRRLEGASDAAELGMVVWVECPVCGAHGVLTLGYGPNASPADLAVLPFLDLAQADAGATTTGE